MKQDIAQLLKCLNTHKHLYGILLEKCEEKRRAIIANDVKDLERILGEEEGIVKQIEAVEGLRVKSAEAVAARLGIEGRITHDKIMDKDEEARKAFGNTGAEVKKILERLKDLNSVNNMLIHKRLSYIEDIKNGFFENLGNNYGADGKDNVSKVQSTNLFDRMV